MDKIFPNTSTDKPAFNEITVFTKGECIVVSLVHDTPVFSKKYMKLLISDTDRLYFVTVNPSPVTVVDTEYTIEPTMLTLLPLQEQWDWVLSRWKLDFNLRSMYNWFEELIMMPERTAEGVIHFHLIVRLRPDRLSSDIPRWFWDQFDIKCEKPNSQTCLNKFKSITKYMVKVEPVEDEGIIDYFFNKDEHKYEQIYDRKIKDGYPFAPLRLQYYNVSLPEEKSRQKRTSSNSN